MSDTNKSRTEGPMTAAQAREQTATRREANRELVDKILAYYRDAISQEAKAGNYSAPHYPAERLQNYVTRHELAEVQEILIDLGYTIDEKGVSWGVDLFNAEYGGTLARAINTRFVRRTRTDAEKDGGQ